MRQLVPFVLCSLLFGCKAEAPPSKLQEAIPVKITLPFVQDVPLNLEALGTLHPSLFLEIYPQMDGTLEEILVKEGDFVEAKTPLFQIDDKINQLKVKEAEATLLIDEACLLAAKRKWERLNQLHDKEVIAKTEWDKYELEAAKAAHKILLTKAQLEKAYLDVKQCTISAPFSGRIGKIGACPGMRLTSTTSIATLSKIDRLIVEFFLTEKEFDLLNEKRDLHIFPFGKQDFFRGSITFVDSGFEKETGQIQIRGKVPNPELKMLPGQTVRVQIPLSIQQDALLIPGKAIKRGRSGPYVYIVNNDSIIEERSVVLGKELQKNTIIKEGLFPEDKVVLEGHLRIYPGALVEIQS